MKTSEAVYILGKLISPTYRNKEELLEIVCNLGEDWESVIAVANRHLLVAVLYHTLCKKELFDAIEDEMLKEYLKEVYKRNTLHNKNIISQLQEIATLFNSINVTPLLLKGAAALSENHYGDIGLRFMLDIDVVVPEEKIFKCLELLKENGYSEIDSKATLGKHWHHYKRLYKANGATSLELHRYLSSNKALKCTLDFQKKSYSIPATKIKNTSVLNPTYEFFYTFLHSEIAHNQRHNFLVSLRHLHHAAILYEKYKEDIDIQEIEHYIHQYKLEKIWHEYLYILQNIFHIETAFYTPKMKRYEKKMKRNFDNEGTTLWYVKVFFQRTYKAFSYTTLQNRYNNLRSHYQLLYYIPIRFFTLSYKIITDKKRREKIIKGIKSVL